MSVSDEYLEFVLDQLRGLGSVFHKRMFGGVGLYYEDLFFGLIAKDVLFFKVDDSNRGRYAAAGAPPFRPYGEKGYSISYYEVPADILEDHEAVTRWAREAIKVASLKGSHKPLKAPSRGDKASNRRRSLRRHRTKLAT